jgi:amino acid adenylation domain-containing protein/non-ribosomal peptide synthase protein (TIGR01720 family)
MTDLLKRLDGLSPEKRHLLLRRLGGEAPPVRRPQIARLPRRAGETLPLSFTQQRLWFLEQLEPGTAAYHIPAALRLHGGLDLAALERSLAEVVRRHEVLRTAFPARDGIAVQEVSSSLRPDLAILDLGRLPPVRREALALELARAQARLPFDLARGPLLRARLLRLERHDHVVLLILHHLVSDGWSTGVLIEELSALYTAFSAGRPSPLPELAVHYADFAVWQREWLTGQVLADHLAYWRRRLAGAPPLLDLPTDRPRPRRRSGRGAGVRFVLAAAPAGAVASLCAERQVTLFMVLLTAFTTLLHRYSHQDQILIGSPIVNRHPEVERLVGCFANTLVLRTDLAGDPRLSALLAQVRDVTLEAYAHQDLPFEKLVDELRPERSLGHSPLFQVMLTLQNLRQRELRLPGLTLRELPVDAGAAQFDLELVIAESPAGLQGLLCYDTDLFDRTTAVRLTGHLARLLPAAAARPDCRISELPLLGAPELHQLLGEWNDSAEPLAGDGCVHRLFERWAARTPAATALVCDGRSWSYGELNRRANRLARLLIRRGIGAERTVALLVDRGPDFLTAALALLKAGAAWLPLDPLHPPARSRQILEQSGAALLLVARAHLPCLAGLLAPPADSLAPASLLDEILAISAGDTDLPCACGPATLVYVLYTSGSTGVPKGAMVVQQGLISHLRAKIRETGLVAGDVVAQTAPLTFDISIWQFLAPLLVGARVHVFGERLAADPRALLAEVAGAGVTILETSPSQLATWVAELEPPGAGRPNLAALRRLMVTGDALGAGLCRRWLAVCPGVPLINAYGATETSDDVAHWHISAPPPDGAGRVSIGPPVAGSTLYVLDGRLQALPVGVVGELYAGGLGVCRGYRNDPGRTAEAFLPDPFAAARGARLYRTGDLARRAVDGGIEILGRADFQVKIRGFRVELGEIEAVLAAHPAVHQAAVLARRHGAGESRLVAYAAMRGDPSSAPGPSELRAFVAGRLPEFMVPSAFVRLAALPLTPHGKIDRRALPEPGPERPQLAAPFTAPRTPAERTMARIWADLLRLDQVGVDDNFFELGGDSILSIQIVARCQQAGLRLTPRQLFENQTVAELAALAEAALPPAAGSEAALLPLTPAQRQWLAAGGNRVDGAARALLVHPRRARGPARWRLAVHHLLHRHEALRLRLRAAGESAHQQVEPAPGEPPFTWLDLSALPAAQRDAAATAAAAALPRGLSPARGAVCRTALLRLDCAGAEAFALALHPLAADDASWAIAIGELAALASGGAAAPLLRRRRFSRWLHDLERQADSPEPARELAFWLAMLAPAAAPPHPPRPAVAAAPARPSRRALRVSLAGGEARALCQDVARAYRTTLHESVLSALAGVLARFAGEERLAIALTADLRAGDRDLEHTVGPLSPVFPMVFRLASGSGPGELLIAIKEQLRAVPHHGAGYGLLLCARGRDEEVARLHALPPPPWAFAHRELAAHAPDGTDLLVRTEELAGREPPWPGNPALAVVSSLGAAAERLDLVWWYDPGRLPQAAVEELAGEHVAALRELIRHCSQPGAGRLTPADFPLARLDQETLDRALSGYAEIEDVYPLAPTQFGMLFHHLYAGGRPFYELASWTLRGHLDVAAFRLTWERILERHPALRSSYIWEGVPEPLQVVSRRVELPWQEEDWRGVAHAEQQRRLEQDLLAERDRGLDLSRAPCMRLRLIRLEDDRYQFTWSWHHIVLDGWSMTTITRQGLALYDALRRGREAPPESHRPYRDYIVWLQRQDRAAAEAFWRRMLAGYAAPPRLAFERPPSGSPPLPARFHGTSLRLRPAAAAALRALARHRQLTLNTLFQAAWTLSLARYSGQSDVVFGVTSSGRPADLDGVELMVGLFLLTLPLRVRVEAHSRVLPWLHELQRRQIEQRQYEYCSLLEVRSWSEVSSEVPLFASYLVFQNFPEVTSEQWHSEELVVESARGFAGANEPLLVMVRPAREPEIRVSFDSDRFDELGIRRMVGQLEVLLEALAAGTDCCLADLPLLTAAERHQVLLEWNEPDEPPAADGCLHGQFEQQAARCPERVALSGADGWWTYGELNRRANRLARALAHHGLGPERLLALLVVRGVEFATAALATVKLGGAFLPLDAGQPPARLRQLLGQSGAAALLVSAALASRLSEILPPPGGSAAPSVLELDALLAPPRAESDLPCRCQPRQLAYVIYTSGSTGTPKGAMVMQDGLLNHLRAKLQWFALGRRDVVAQNAPMSFDISIWQFLAPLLAGGRVQVVADEAAHDPLRLLHEVEQAGVSVLETGPSLLGALLEELERLGPARPAAASLRWLLVSGEALPPALCRRWLALYPQVPLINAYGPTECSDDVTWQVIRRPLPAGSAHTPLGFPIAASALYVLDGELRPLPIGVPGEIHLGGLCVGRGYRDDPARTAEVFVPDPFAALAGGRLYRTGDLGRRRPDGGSEYLGRLDFQVKVRGNRVEPGEIEALLAQHPGVQQAVVVALPDHLGETSLAAYLVPVTAGALAAEPLRRYLRERVPEAMVPAAFVILAELPRTVNDKVDRRALPPPGPAGSLAPAPEPPRTAVEQTLAAVWQEVLGRRQVGVHDDFFALGGHSLRAIQVVSRLRRALAVELPLRLVFERPVLADLAAAIEEVLAEARLAPPPLRAVARDGRPLPLSFAQQRLWFIDQLEPGNTAYNTSTALRLSGRPDLAALTASFGVVVGRHEALRTTFSTVDGEPLQLIAAPVPLALPLLDLGALSAAARAGELRRLAAAAASRPFDLARGPLLRAGVLRLASDEHIVLAAMHHIVSDAWSVQVLHREVRAAYEALCHRRRPVLPELPIQYADYASWQRQWLQGEALAAEVAHWRRRLQGAAEVLALPHDRPRPAVQPMHGASRKLPLSRLLAEQVRALARQQGVTLFMALLAVFAALLGRYARQWDLCVGTPVAGRTRIELEGLIGFFVNTLVLRIELGGEPVFCALLGRVKEICLEAQTHQDLPFEKLVEELEPVRSLGQTPLFQVMFSTHEAAQPGPGTGEQSVDPAGAVERRVPFDLDLTVVERTWQPGPGPAAAEPGPPAVGQLVAGLEYATDLFDATTMGRLLSHFAGLLGAVVEDPGRRLSALPMMSAAEVHQLVVESNDTRAAEPWGGCVHGLFERQAARVPEALALSDGEGQWSYGELNRRANRLAWALRRRGIGEERLVAVLVGRGMEFAVAALALLKLGAAFLPLDPGQPAARIRRMWTQSGAAALLVGPDLLSRLSEIAEGVEPGAAPPVLELPALLAGGGAESDPPCRCQPRQLAYVIYTSGSTGTPKGAMVMQDGLLNHLRAMLQSFALGCRDVVAQSAPLSFDISIWQFLAPLLAGGRVQVVADEAAHDPLRLLHEVEQAGVSVLETGPSLLGALLEELERLGPARPAAASLRWLLVTGEALPPALCRRWLALYPQVPLINAYGPAECSDDVTWQVIRRPLPAGSAHTPLGGPIAHSALYVLDRELRPVPWGGPGEICLGGLCVGRGYRGEPARTAEVFVPDPWSAEPGGRLYRTGDLGRFSGGGSEYLGRIDFQVKVRGHRVEPGEVEAVLGQHPSVRQAVVLALPDARGETSLVAYVVAAGEELAAEPLRRHLRARLPEVMVPAGFVMLAELPRTANDKVDRRALAALPRPRPPGPGSEAAPSGPVEELLAGIWSQVLGIERVGTRESFFDLGGHSLLATRVVSRVRATFGVELPLRSLFEAPTIAGLAREVAARRGAGGAAGPPLRPRPGSAAVPLSFAQQRLWFLDQLEPGSAAYNVPLAVRFSGRLDVAALRWSLGEVVRRHEVLRTTFALRAGEPVQVIAAAAPPALPVVDLGGVPEAPRGEEAVRLARAEARRPFDLARGPLLRAGLLRLAAADQVLLANMHHIVSDGWSRGVLQGETAALYPACLAGRPSPLPELPVQYADFALWQRGWLCGEVLAGELSYWRERLRGAPPLLALPTDRPRPAVQSARGAVRRLALGRELSGGVESLARAGAATPFMTLLAAYQALLGRYAGQSDICVGTPIAGRTRLELEGLIGFFVNTLVLRGDLGGDPTFSALVSRVREASLEAHAHQDLPFEKLVEELAPVRSLAHLPLFQVMFVLQYQAPEAPPLPGLQVRALGVDSGTARCDLTLALSEEPAGISGTLEYCVDLFDAVTVERMLGHFAELLRGAVAAPRLRLSQLPVLSPAQRHQAVSEWNDGAVGERRGRWPYVHELIAAEAASRPLAPALLWAGGSMSYGELERRSNRVAEALGRLGVGAEVRVGLLVERSPEMVVGLLGILKAGGAYVPLDPGSPLERLAFVLEDAGVAAVLSTERLSERLPVGGALLLCLDEAGGVLAGESEETPAVWLDADNLAYLIYTSGSTGRPKGVGVCHRGLSNLVEAQRLCFAVGRGERVLQFAALSFDASIFEIVMALCSGSALVLGSRDEVLPGPPLAALLGEQGISNATLPPSALAVLPAGELPALRTLIVAGEACPGELARRWARGRRLFNAYGPTEATVWSSVERVGDGELSLGRPIANTRLHLLDGGLEPLPLGVAGELHIGGVGLARGYLGRPDLTAERFVPDPLGGVPGGRLYRSGDLGRRLPDGRIDFLGRIDDQVKIRGFRIEPGEVEAVLAAHPAVREVAVVALEDESRGRRLAAFVAGAGGSTPDAGELRRHLGERLPAYMIPAQFVPLEALPVNPSGKVDRRALCHLAKGGRDEAIGYVAPRDIVEEVLAGIWSEVLGGERVGADDNFFDLGGHSLLASRLRSRVQAALGVDLPLRAVFEAPTLAGLAHAVGAAQHRGRAAAPPLTRQPRGSLAPLSFAQQRLWFIDQLEPGGAAYNIALAVHLAGRLEFAVLRRSLEEVVRRHEVLRTTFVAPEGEPMQVIAPPAPPPLPLVDLSSLPAAAREPETRRLALAEAHRPFDLARGPLLRAGLLRLARSEQVLVATMHHIVGDAWSQTILQREVATLYAAFSQSRPSPLAELPVQYADFALWQRGWLRGDTEAAELDYWRGRLAGMPAVLALPGDHPRPAVQSFRGASRTFSLAAELSHDLGALARAGAATLFMTLLAGFEALLARHAGEPDFAVGTPVHGRSRLELEGLIGFFVNTLVLRADLGGDPSFSALVGRVREASLEAHSHQDLPFERLVEELAPVRSLAHSPLFQVMFALQHPEPPPQALAAVAARPLGLPGGTAKFDLALAMSAAAQGLTGTLEYCVDLFDGVTVERLIGHFAELLRGAVREPCRPLSHLPVLSAAQLHQVLREWNDTLAGGPPPYLHQQLSALAARWPQAPAVAGEDACLSYGALDRRSNRVAQALRRLGVGPEVAVGLCVGRVPERLVGLLGIWKAGGVYVPLDPDHPPERLAFMLADARAAVLLTERALADRIPATAAAALCLDHDGPLAGESTAAVDSRLDPDNLAYLIYTSGSTGQPKGAAITHRALANVLQAAQRRCAVQPGERVLQLSSLGFDASLLEMGLALGAGGVLVLSRRDALLAGPRLAATLREHAINVMALAPSALALVPVADLPALRTVLVGAEPCPPELAWQWREGRELFNCYGPTEATVFVTAARLGGADRVTIGLPIDGTRVHLLDASLGPVAPGASGELHISGTCLARGYLGRPDLTAEKFIPDPYSEQPGSRLYRSGDLARRLADGRIDFLARIDRQVKIRGFRIELGEVEAALLRHPAVREAVVLAQEDRRGDAALVAYLSAAATALPPPAGELRRFLAETLPDYMLPAGFVWLASLPRSHAGKIDRLALLRTWREHARAERDGSPLGDPVQGLLAGLFAEVLGVEAVAAGDDFFDLGGHSLLATRLVSRIREAFGVELSLRSLFEAPTVAALAGEVAAALRGGRLALPPLTALPRVGPIPLSFAQQRLWFIDRLEPGTAAYNMPVAVRFTGPLETAVLARALSEVVRRHEVLRTSFAAPAGEPMQVIAAAAPVPLPVVDLALLPSAAREAEALRLAAAAARRPFDLACGPLFRVGLLRLAAADQVLLATLHHSVSDGWSMELLNQEVAALYDAFARGEPSPLPELPVQYADFALWQRHWLQGEVLAAELAHWRRRLRGMPMVLELPADRPRPPVYEFRGASRAFALSAPLSAGLRAVCRAGGATSFMTLLAAFQALLSRHARLPDIVVGTPIAGRTLRELEPLIGCFVNVLVLRGDLAGDPSFQDLVARTREVCLDAYAHQELPFERLVEELDPQRSLAHPPLFQVVFVLQNLPRRARPFAGVTARELASAGAQARFDLRLVMTQTAAGFAAVLESNACLFDAATMRRLAEQFCHLLAGAVAAPRLRLSQLPVLSPAQRHQAVSEWNDGAVGERRGRWPYVHELIAAEAASRPLAPALLWAGGSMSYGELERRSNRVAEALGRLGVGAEVRVGLLVERSPEMVVGLLGILKAGGAYVPLDPGSPLERLAFVLEDAGVAAVLSTERLSERLPVGGALLLCLDEAGGVLAGESEETPAVWLDADNLAYLIYTSGSTGRPKGVGVCHRGLSNLVEAQRLCFAVGRGERVLQFAALSFDASIFEIVMALCSGSALVLGSRDEVLPGPPLAALLGEQGISNATLPPSALAVLPAGELPALRTLIVAGEACPGELARRWARGRRLFNAYGPTEATVWSSVERVGDGELSLGRPIANTRLHLLDGGLEPLPLGVAGELHIGGVGLARGYLGRPDLTAERFVPDPLGGVPGGRLYRSGDLGRRLPDGRIDFLGRIDDQVKIRGFRIEPGEVEAVLAAHPAVREVAVVALEDESRGRRLAAFVAGAGGSTPDAGELRRHLGERLPAYMIPAQFVPLEALPVNPSGKVDRRALPALAAQAPAAGEPVSPRDHLELGLTEIWQEVLGRSPIGIDDDFFALGGHSLLAVTLLVRIRQRFGRDLPLATLFAGPTVERLAVLLRQGREPGERSALVEIKPGTGPALSLFCLHPASGSVLCYAELAKGLEPPRAVYGLQVPEAAAGEPPAAALEEIAARYLALVRQLQPAGPYLLLGWSMGGVLAFEMARQLRRRGERVELLALLDTVAPLPAALPREPPDEATLLQWFVRDLAGLYRGDAALVVEEASCATAGRELRLQELLAQAHAAHLLPPDVDLPAVERLYSVFARNVRSLQGYAAHPYEGPITLLRTDQAAAAWGPALGWEDLSAGPLEVVPVPGGHYSIVRKPALDAVTACLRQRLAALDARTAATTE